MQQRSRADAAMYSIDFCYMLHLQDDKLFEPSHIPVSRVASQRQARPSC